MVKRFVILTMGAIFLTLALAGCSLSVDTSADQEKATPRTRASYDVNRVPSQQPPNDRYGNPILPAEAPQFVIIGYDDNQYADGMWNILNIYKNLKNPPGSGNPLTYDGFPARASFYMTPGGRDSQYEWVVDSDTIKSWQEAYNDGHEIGNHTYYHEHGLQFTQERWADEIARCAEFLINTVGIPSSAITGFRTPFLEYNPSLYPALKAAGIEYDNSFEGGLRYWPQEDGSTLYWPYTMDSGRPEGSEGRDFGIVPGMWQMPTDCVFIPGDKLERVTGFDYNLWFSRSYTKQQFLDVLKYSLLQKYNGNRSPMNFGGHTNYYSDAGFEDMKIYDSASVLKLTTTVIERTEAIKEFLDYALTLPDVRVVTTQQALEWVKKPVALGTPFVQHDITVETGARGIAEPSGIVKVIDGDDLLITLVPDAGYMVDSVTVDGSPVVLTNNQFLYPGVKAPSSFKATFKVNPDAVLYTVTASSDAFSTLSREGAVVVEKGDSLTFDVTLEPGYTVTELRINSALINNPVFPYTLTAVNQDTTFDIVTEHLGEPYTMTYYWTYNYKDEPVNGGPQVELLTSNNEVIAVVEENLAKRISMEGSGFLPDGRLINLSNGYDWPNSRFFVVDPLVAPYGYDSQGGPLQPWISVAVDTAVIPLNSDVYVKEFDGVKLPDGSLHKGWFKAVDTSHSFSGKWIDIFTMDYPGYLYMNDLLQGIGVVTAKHQPGQVFTITPSHGPYGGMWPNTPIEAAEGTDRSFTFYMDPGYIVDKVFVDGVAVEWINDVYTFKNIQKNSTIEVSFKKGINAGNYTVTASAGANGTVSSSVSSVKAGESAVYTVTPEPGYIVDSAALNGKPVLITGNSLTVGNINEDTLLYVTFKPGNSTGVSAAYSMDEEWNTGFSASLVIKNNSDVVINSWHAVLTYNGNQQLSGWNGQIVQDGKTVHIYQPSWEGSLAPGQSMTVGLNGTYSGVNELPQVVIE